MADAAPVHVLACYTGDLLAQSASHGSVCLPPPSAPRRAAPREHRTRLANACVRVTLLIGPPQRQNRILRIPTLNLYADASRRADCLADGWEETVTRKISCKVMQGWYPLATLNHRGANFTAVEGDHGESETGVSRIRSLYLPLASGTGDRSDNQMVSPAIQCPSDLDYGWEGLERTTP